MTQPAAPVTDPAPTAPTIVNVIVIPFTRRLASPSAQVAHLVSPDGQRIWREAICSAKSESWQPVIDGLPLCDPCRQECLRRMASKLEGSEPQGRAGWEPDMSRTCTRCGCKSVVDGACAICLSPKEGAKKEAKGTV